MNKYFKIYFRRGEGMQFEYRKKIYASYVTNGFGETHTNEKMYQIQKKYFKKNYLKYLPEDKNARICDLGCGCGEFVRFLVETGYKYVTGVDTSVENIERCNSLNMKNALLLCEDIEKFLDENDEKFDAIVFNDVIEHLTKDEIIVILCKIQENIKDFGCVLIKTPNMANPFVNTAGRYIDFTHEIGFTEYSMRQVLRATDYKNIKIIGTDIYVMNPIISIIAKLFSKIINIFLYLFSYLYGRKEIKIFEKDILAIAWKKG